MGEPRGANRPPYASDIVTSAPGVAAGERACQLATYKSRVDMGRPRRMWLLPKTMGGGCGLDEAGGLRGTPRRRPRRAFRSVELLVLLRRLQISQSVAIGLQFRAYNAIRGRGLVS